MSGNPNIPRVRPGDRVSAQHTNRLVSRANRNLSSDGRFISAIGEVSRRVVPRQAKAVATTIVPVIITVVHRPDQDATEDEERTRFEYVEVRFTVDGASLSWLPEVGGLQAEPEDERTWAFSSAELLKDNLPEGDGETSTETDEPSGSTLQVGDIVPMVVWEADYALDGTEAAGATGTDPTEERPFYVLLESSGEGGGRTQNSFLKTVVTDVFLDHDGTETGTPGSLVKQFEQVRVLFGPDDSTDSTVPGPVLETIVDFEECAGDETGTTA